jgi:hypothetical protein
VLRAVGAGEPPVAGGHGLPAAGGTLAVHARHPDLLLKDGQRHVHGDRRLVYVGHQLDAAGGDAVEHPAPHLVVARPPALVLVLELRRQAAAVEGRERRLPQAWEQF